MNLYLGVAVDDAPSSTKRVPVDPSVWLAFTRHFADALHALRSVPPLRDASLSEWTVFTTQATAWARAEEGLTQSELAVRTGLNVRTIRRMMLSFEDAGIVASSRVGVVVGYAPGATFLALLSGFAEARGTPDPDDTAPARVSPGSGLGRSTPDRRSAVRGATPDPGGRTPARLGDLATRNTERFRVDPTLPDPVVAPIRSALLIKEIKLTSSSPPSEVETPANPTTPATRTVSTKRLDRDGIRAAACRALAARFVFGKPGRVAPETFSPEDVETLMNVTAHCSWTEPELDQAHRDAILGASLHSKAQPPTVGYVWGKQGFFDRNVLLGREKRKESEPVVKPPKKPKPPDEPPATFAELMEIGRRGVALLDGPARFETKHFDRTRFSTKEEDHE